MSNSQKAVTTAKKISPTNLQTRLMPVVDGIMKIAAGLFFIACTYGYIQQWLKLHQGQVDLSIEGSILVVSVALYLYCRKR